MNDLAQQDRRGVALACLGGCLRGKLCYLGPAGDPSKKGAGSSCTLVTSPLGAVPVGHIRGYMMKTHFEQSDVLSLNVKRNNNYPRMTALCMRFPTLRSKADCESTAKGCGIEPFDSMRLWHAARAWSSGERAAVDFILSVFNPTEWRFDVHDALATWDQDHREAFIRWAAAPWWE